MIDNNKYLNILLRTWTNDIGGMYDYSSKAIKDITDKVIESTYVVRNRNNTFENKSQHSEIASTSDLLFKAMNDKKDSFMLVNPIPKNLKLTNENCFYLNNKIWYVIKSEENNENENNNEDYFLSVNDIIKFGKIKFAVQNIHIENNMNYEDPPMPSNELDIYDLSNLNKNTPPVFDFVFKVKYSKNVEINNNFIYSGEKTIDYNNDKTTKINDNTVCAICKKENYEANKSEYGEVETDTGESNILICLCNCKEKGLVHPDCLRKKLVIKQECKKNDDVITIEDFECPICKEQYPLRYKFESNGETKYLIEEYNNHRNGDYMVLESLDYFKDDKYCKIIHFIKLNNDYITIGRESENDIVEKDISISRNHAVLKYNKNNYKICLQNKSKKFGTLVLVKKPIRILDKKIHLQVGRTYIEAKLEKKSEQ